MNIHGDHYIAGWKTADDWRAFRRDLVPGDGSGIWQTAFKDYFLQRLSLRYLNPIKILQESGTSQGEGFSIVAIQCTLVEFLESTVQGLNYRYLRKGEKLRLHEYSFSSKIYVSFLRNRQPFSATFDEASALDFYVGVRCGLLHEARTKNGWKIWAQGSGGVVANIRERIVYRDDFQAALLQFIDSYRDALPSDISLQQAFVRKFDSLCE